MLSKAEVHVEVLFQKIKVWHLGTGVSTMCEVLGRIPNTKQKEKAESFFHPVWKLGLWLCQLRLRATVVAHSMGSACALLVQSPGHLPLCEGAKVGPCRESLQPSCPLLAS